MVQALSCLFNRLFLNDHLRHGSRLGCEIAVVLLVLFFIYLFIQGSSTVAAGLIALFFIAPFLAIWYGAISYKETRYVRSLVDRKQYV
ncbi:hypothetical protein GCM10023093_02810 [Nemorincola caseinilytica]|uniref:Uncharacterized protein n=1 Tax=Nemorincola caseinilytica TaxID=2054315 RepID=A0ABP8N5G0_9BACT